MKPVRIGVIGVGTWGRNHARVLATLPEADLIGCCDTDGRRAEAAAGAWGGRAFEDLDALLAEVEAVTVAVPTTAHAATTLHALAAGVHVLVEKPIASTPREAERMEEEARRTGLLLAVGQIERFNPAVAVLLASSCDPRFVEIHRLSPFDVRGLDVSVVADLMIHDIDVLLRIVQSPLAALEATGVPVLSRRIDIANARLRFENGCVANLTASRVSLVKTRKIRIFESARYISVDYADQSITIYRRRGDPPAPEHLAAADFSRFVAKETPPVERGEPLRIEIQSFLRAVRGGGAPIVSPSEGRAALDVAQRIVRAMERAGGVAK